MKKVLLLCLAIWLSPISSFAQTPDHLAGNWSGWLTQPNHATAFASRYTFSLALAADFQYASSEITLDSLAYYGIMESRVSLTNECIIFNETKITAQFILGGYWYLKKYRLFYHPEDDSLRGRWWTPDGDGGKIILFRTVVL